MCSSSSAYARRHSNDGATLRFQSIFWSCKRMNSGNCVRADEKNWIGYLWHWFLFLTIVRNHGRIAAGNRTPARSVICAYHLPCRQASRAESYLLHRTSVSVNISVHRDRLMDGCASLPECGRRRRRGCGKALTTSFKSVTSQSHSYVVSATETRAQYTIYELIKREHDVLNDSPILAPDARCRMWEWVRESQ